MCEETCDQENEGEEEEKETVSFHNGRHCNVEVESDCTKVHSASLPQPSPQANDSKKGSKKTQLGLQSELEFLHAHFPSENRGHITDDRTKQSCNEVIDHTTSHEDRTEQTHVEPTKTDESSQCLSVEQFYSSNNKRAS